MTFQIIALALAINTESYVIQTMDDKLHFITDHVETYPLPYNTENHSLSIPNYPNLPEALQRNEDNAVVRVNRLDEISINSDGIIEFYDFKIGIKEILHSPVVERAIYFSATQEHIPSMVNNTIVILASTKVFLLDFYNYNSKILTHKQILYLYQAHKNIQRKDNEIFVNGRWWTFNSNIVAVFIIKEKDGFNFMLRVLNNSEMQKYENYSVEKYRNSTKFQDLNLYRDLNRYGTSHNHNGKQLKRRYLLAYISIVFSIIMYITRNLKYTVTILKEKLFLGKFVKKDCLIYKISSSLLKETKKLYHNVKSSCLVQVYYETDGFLNPLIVTEKTYQFYPAVSTLTELISPEPDQFFYNQQSENDTFFEKKFDFFPDQASQLEIMKFKSNINAIITTFEYLHSINIVHSRICPENIRISEHENIRIQNLFENHGWRSMNQLKNIKRKNYKSDISDDIFSLGCLLHYYLTGYHPFDLRDYVKKDRKPSKKNIDFMNANRSWMNGDNNNFIGQDKIVNSLPIDKHSVTPEPKADLESGSSTSEQNQNFELAGLAPKSNLKLALIRIFTFLKLNTISKFIFSKILIFTQLSAIQWLVAKFIRALNIIFRNFILSAVYMRFQSLNISQFFIKTSQKEKLEKIYKRIISDDAINYIEYNILFNTYKIRLDDQVEHDFIYHSIRTPIDLSKLKLSSHPYFWDGPKCLEFISDISDFLESNPNFKARLERTKKLIFQGSWVDYLNSNLIRTVSIKRFYDFQSLSDLIRFIRNCHRHFQEINTKSLFKALEGRLFGYFSYTFPELLMFLYRNTSFKDQLALKKYYE